MSGDRTTELERLLSEPTAKAVVRAFMHITPSITAVVRSPDMKVLFVSEFAARLAGVAAADLQSVSFETYCNAIRVFWPDGRPVEPHERLLFRATRGETIQAEEGLILDSQGALIPIICNAAPITNAQGEVMGGVLACSDVRKMKALESELRVAYREMVHRVKNHLQIMSGLIALDARDPDLTAAELAERNQARLQMLAAVYDGMTQAEAGERIAAPAFVELVCRPYRSEKIAVEARVEPDDLTVPAEQAAPLGMLLNEAVCNSYKHAFPGGAGTIWVRLRREPAGAVVLEVADDGVGIPDELPEKSSHGLMLMRMQAEKLHASFEVARRPGGGAVVRSVMPGGL